MITGFEPLTQFWLRVDKKKTCYPICNICTMWTSCTWRCVFLPVIERSHIHTIAFIQQVLKRQLLATVSPHESLLSLLPQSCWWKSSNKLSSLRPQGETEHSRFTHSSTLPRASTIQHIPPGPQLHSAGNFLFPLPQAHRNHATSHKKNSHPSLSTKKSIPELKWAWKITLRFTVFCIRGVVIWSRIKRTCRVMRISYVSQKV